MEILKNWAFSICCASVSGGIINMLLPENSLTKTFKTVFCVFFLCIIISPFSEIDKNDLLLFDDISLENEDFSENMFIENSAEYIESEITAATNKILSEENIDVKDILINVNISEDGNINISKFTLILSDIENISDIEQKIFQETGIKPDITIFGENKNE